MKTPHLTSIQTVLPHIVLAVSLFSLYLATLAPGLTWANDGRDGGDLITAAATNGVAHPTGYPLYLLLARLFQCLPIGSLAFRTNLMSALLTALAAGLLSHLVTHCVASSTLTPGWPAGVAAGLAFGASPVIWSQAVITEVYALQALLILCILLLYRAPASSSGKERSHQNRWRALILGLALGNHLTTLLFVPVAVLLGAMPGSSEGGDTFVPRSWKLHDLRLDWRALVQQLAWFGLGLSIYLILPLRAGSSPPVNWGNAMTWPRFWWLVSGQLYQDYLRFFDLAGLWERIQAAAALLLQQFGTPGLLFGLLGLVVFGSRSRLYILTTWTAASSLVFALLYGSQDAYVYLIPVLISFSIWIGSGLAGLVSGLSRRSSRLALSLAVLLVVYFVARPALSWNEVDASEDLRAESFGREVLAAAPENAMIFAKGDEAVFTLWYFHFALGQRPDLVVVANDLLHFDWYQETLRSTYPALVLPGPFPWPETLAFANPSRTACSAQYEDETKLQCVAPRRMP
jgi:hypothetical protein